MFSPYFGGHPMHKIPTFGYTVYTKNGNIFTETIFPDPVCSNILRERNCLRGKIYLPSRPPFGSIGKMHMLAFPLFFPFL